jgi:hypothetical protein
MVVLAGKSARLQVFKVFLAADSNNHLASHGARRHSIGKKVFLWERLPAAILSRQDAAPT